MTAAPDSRRAKHDRQSVLEYQANYLADKFHIPVAEARSFVDRFGVNRLALSRAVRGQLQEDRTRFEPQ
jgi:hypothetical protein